MIRFLGKMLLRGASRLRRSERGSSTIEFVLWVPFFMTILMSSIEGGLFLVQQVMLERSLDLTVRDLRIGTLTNPSHDDLKIVLCDRVLIIPACKRNLMIDLVVVSTTDWALPARRYGCVDRSLGDDLQPKIEFTVGGKNDIVMIAACIKVKPFFVTTGIGLQMPRDEAGMYAMAASSAFANEPRN